jgi:hypothetical protein
VQCEVQTPPPLLPDPLVDPPLVDTLPLPEPDPLPLPELPELPPDDPPELDPEPLLLVRSCAASSDGPPSSPKSLVTSPEPHPTTLAAAEPKAMTEQSNATLMGTPFLREVSPATHCGTDYPSWDGRRPRSLAAEARMRQSG